MATVITPWEVIRYSPAGSNYPTEKICNNIRQVEEDFFYRCFGQTFYEYLQDHLNEYPDPEPGLWDAGDTYATGDYVVYEGCLYRSLQNTNTGKDPASETEWWALFEKFDDACLNRLWTGYLRPYLAHVLYAESLLFTTQNSGAGGITVRSNDRVSEGSGIRTANMNEISAHKATVMDLAAKIYENMIRYINLNAQTCTEYQNILACNNNCGPAVKKAGRRIAFR